MSRASENDAMRRKDTLYEIHDPRNRIIDTNPHRRYRTSDFDPEDRLRHFDSRVFCADSEFTAPYYDESPRDHRVIEFEAERVWREGKRVTSIAARYTTEQGSTDPNDEGFLLWYPLAMLTVLERHGDHYRIALDKRLFDRWEIEDLIPRAPHRRGH